MASRRFVFTRSPDLFGTSDGAHHVAPMAEGLELAINAITAWPSFVAKRQRLARTREALTQFVDRNCVVGNLAKVFHGARAPALRHRDLYSFFVDVQANKSGMVHDARLLCMRLCAGQPA